MVIKTESIISRNLIDLFRPHKVYEKIVHEMINSSSIVFPGQFEYFEKQPNGEPDYICISTGEKYDAKLPFTEDQVEILTDGKKHKPKVKEWLDQLKTDAEDFNPLLFRNNLDYYISSTRLYMIMKAQLKKDKTDEHFIYFIPYPIVKYSDDENDILNHTSNFLNCIFDTLQNEKILYKRNIFVILPSSKKNMWVLVDLKNRCKEFIKCDKLEQYISYQQL